VLDTTRAQGAWQWSPTTSLKQLPYEIATHAEKMQWLDWSSDL
jgi:hypothetical protein